MPGARTGGQGEGMESVISLTSVSRRYPRGVLALHDVSLDVPAGQFVAVMGATGSGKSTLLHLAAGLDRPTGGRVGLIGRDITRMGEARLTRLRRDRAGFVFQAYNLLSELTVRQNVALPARLGGPRGRGIDEVLAQVGLADRENEWPARLSGGQRQRVALARALVHHPRLLLLDEPLGALDALTRIEMHRLIESLWQTHRFTALLVTHDVQEAVALADRVILIEDGVIALDERIDLARPRSHGPAFALLEQRILDRVLQKPSREAAPDPNWLASPAHALRWAV